jgi:hypothetical protein
VPVNQNSGSRLQHRDERGRVAVDEAVIDDGRAERSTTGVSVATNDAISTGLMPRTSAQAAALSGCACRNVTSLGESQLAIRWVPPNSPAAFDAIVPPDLGSGVSG